MNSPRTQDLYRPAAELFQVVQVGLLAGVLGSSGCLSRGHRIDRYLSTNTDRPEAVVQALRDADRLVPGMTPQEVRLIMGSPARTEAGNAPVSAIWHYDQASRRDDSSRRSDMWVLPIPSRTVVFGAGNTVTGIIEYDDPVDQPKEAKPEVIAIPKRESVVPPPPPATPIPVYRPNPDELKVHGWPAITLQGMTGSGSGGRAVFNGEIYKPGEFIGGVRLDAIYANGVVLEYRGQRAFLRPGESTAGGK